MNVKNDSSIKFNPAGKSSEVMCAMDDQGDILGVGRNESSAAAILMDELWITKVAFAVNEIFASRKRKIEHNYIHGYLFLVVL